MLFVSPDGSYDDKRDYKADMESYQTVYDEQGRVTFKAKEGATLAR